MTSGSRRVQTRQVETPDGRRLRVEVAGDLHRVVVAQVGTPNAGILYDRWVQDAAARGLTLVAYDRPGYGESSPQPGRSHADCAADVRTISQAVGFERCAVWGLSGGGPHALACAALLGDLVAAVATIGSAAPPDGPGFDLDEEDRKERELFLSDRATWEREAREWLAENLRWSSLDEFAEKLSAGKSPGDRAALHGEFGAWLYRAAQAALAPGEEGWMEDEVAYYLPWGFDLLSISVPVKVWHGLDDRFVPIEHGRWLAENIPGAQSELREGDGHLGVVAERIGDVHEWLAQHEWSEASRRNHARLPQRARRDGAVA
jgi:pimeloyl-ACP methyl ester carboxylesterase